MRYAVLCLVVFGLAEVANAAVPTSEAAEFEIMRSSESEPKDLQPGGNFPQFADHRCIAEFGALNAFPPSEHWCVLPRGERFVLKAWRGNSNMPPEPDDPSTPENEAEEVGRYPREWSVVERPLSADLAAAIRQLWLHAILNSRYPPANHQGFDGTTFQFIAQRHAVSELLSAETWSPEGDHPPTWMAEAGLAIYQAAVDNKLNDAKLSSMVAGVRRKVEAFYRRRP